MSTLTGDDILRRTRTTPELADWQPLLGTIRARYATPDFAAGLAFVAAVGEAAEAVDHHPDVVLSYTFVEVRLTSHDVGALTERDVALATTIARIAADRGLAADRSVVQMMEVGLDTPDWREIKPFWSALYGVDPDADPEAAEVVDPAGLLPPLWFQDTDSHDEPRQRFHLDLTIPPHALTSRVAAAVAAGGRVVDDGPSPRFVVLADRQGNRACLCTQVGRAR